MTSNKSQSDPSTSSLESLRLLTNSLGVTAPLQQQPTLVAAQPPTSNNSKVLPNTLSVVRLLHHHVQPPQNPSNIVCIPPPAVTLPPGAKLPIPRMVKSVPGPSPAVYVPPTIAKSMTSIRVSRPSPGSAGSVTISIPSSSRPNSAPRPASAAAAATSLTWSESARPSRLKPASQQQQQQQQQQSVRPIRPSPVLLEGGVVRKATPISVASQLKIMTSGSLGRKPPPVVAKHKPVIFTPGVSPQSLMSKTPSSLQSQPLKSFPHKYPVVQMQWPPSKKPVVALKDLAGHSQSGAPKTSTGGKVVTLGTVTSTVGPAEIKTITFTPFTPKVHSTASSATPSPSTGTVSVKFHQIPEHRGMNSMSQSTPLGRSTPLGLKPKLLHPLPPTSITLQKLQNQIKAKAPSMGPLQLPSQPPPLIRTVGGTFKTERDLTPHPQFDPQPLPQQPPPSQPVSQMVFVNPSIPPAAHGVKKPFVDSMDQKTKEMLIRSERQRMLAENRKKLATQWSNQNSITPDVHEALRTRRLLEVIDLTQGDTVSFQRKNVSIQQPPQLIMPKFEPRVSIDTRVASVSRTSVPQSETRLSRWPHPLILKPPSRGMKRPFEGQDVTRTLRISGGRVEHARSVVSPVKMIQRPKLIPAGSPVKQPTPVRVRDIREDVKMVDEMEVAKGTSSREKLEFMASLGLVTPNKLQEIQTKKSLRKRKAPPSLTLIRQESKRHRMNENGSTKGRNLRIFSPNLLRGRRSGIQARKLVQSRRGGEVDDGHEDSCTVCHGAGQVLMCDSCSRVYHLVCLDPPLRDTPPGVWMCPQCRKNLSKKGAVKWSGTLMVVRSYLEHKSACEQERKQLLEKIQNLRSHRSKLEGKAQTLSNGIMTKIRLKSDLSADERKMRLSLDKLENLVASVSEMNPSMR